MPYVEIEEQETYRCSGHCRRTGFTWSVMLRQRQKSVCPYCSGSLVGEKSGKPPPEPEFPSVHDLANLIKDLHNEPN